MKAILATIIAIPLSTSTGWEDLKFSNIPANKVSYSKSGIEVKVDKSASPLIYPLEQTTLVKRIEAAGKVSNGGVKIKNAKKQGLKGHDDFAFRVGLVLEGDKTLNWLQRKFAPSWVKRLHQLAPEGKGVDHILFFEVANDQSLIGTQRDHYMSEYLKEHIVAAVGPDGEFSINYTFPKPVKVLALWISIDGDDTSSTYTTLIKSLVLHEDKSMN